MSIKRTRGEAGFTLIELLVVILIIGILAAIAIPAFLSQTSKASDSAAKTQVGTLQTAIKTYAIEHSGSFVGGSVAELQAIEPTLNDKGTAIAKETGSLSATGYELKSEAVGSKDVYTLTNTNGSIARTCTPAGKGGCSAAGTW